MKKLIIAAAGIALLAAAGAADAATAKKSHSYSRGQFVERPVRLQSDSERPANGDFRYGPQVDYPQSPAGGGY